MSRLPRHPRPTDMDAVRAAWRSEHRRARQARETEALDVEWHHLERAHILSQPAPRLHVRTHLAMLVHALRRRDRREIIGQVVRVLVAGPGSLLGRYPIGNTGGADVNATTPMDLPDDLAQLLR